MDKAIKIILLLFTLTVHHAFGQSQEELQKHSDSRYRQLLLLEDPEQKAKALFDLSFFWSDYDSTKALGYIQQAEKLLGARSRTRYYKGLSHFYRAAVFFDTDIKRAKQLYLQAEEQLKRAENRHGTEALRHRARLWGSYGALLQREGEPQEYVDILIKKVIPMAIKLRDSTLLGNNYQNVAMALMNLKAYTQAEKYYENGLSLLQGRKESEEQLFTLTVNAARNAMFLRNPIKAKFFLDKAGRLATQLRSSSYLPIYHSVAGSYWAERRELAKADLHFNQALAAADQQQNSDMAATILFDQSTALQAAGNYRAAIKKLLDLLPYVQNRKSLANKQLVYYNLATSAAKLKRYDQAVKWYEAHKALTDSLFADKRSAEITALEKRYQTAEKERAILQLKAHSEQQQLSLQRTRLWTGVLLLSTIVLLLLASTWYAALKHKRKLAAQRELFLQEELKNRQQQQKLQLYNAMLEGQEKERSRIARDLHDGLGGMLASTKLKLSSVASNLMDGRPQETSADLQPIIAQLDHSVDALRRIARNMMPESLIYMGLENALRDLCNGMSQPALEIDFHSSNFRKDYPQTFQIAVYRIMQELLSNAVRHSGAAQVWVQCTEAEGKFHLSVEDNGQGFDPKVKLSSGAGLGFANIRNRVDILNGEFEVDAAIGKGASFHIQLDLHE